MENRTIGKTVGNTANSEYGGKVKSRYKPRPVPGLYTCQTGGGSLPNKRVLTPAELFDIAPICVTHSAGINSA